MRCRSGPAMDDVEAAHGGSPKQQWPANICFLPLPQRPKTQQSCLATIVSHAVTEGPEKGQRAACLDGLVHTWYKPHGHHGVQRPCFSMDWLVVPEPTSHHGGLCVFAFPSPWSVSRQVAATSPRTPHYLCRWGALCSRLHRRHGLAALRGSLSRIPTPLAILSQLPAEPLDEEGTGIRDRVPGGSSLACSASTPRLGPSAPRPGPYSARVLRFRY